MTDHPPLSFPDHPRSELDRALQEVVERAGEVMRTQGRLRALLRATQAVVEPIELPLVLERIVHAAVDLVDAEYGALGVVAPEGGLEEFIHVGHGARGGRRHRSPPRGSRRARGAHRRPAADPAAAHRRRSEVRRVPVGASADGRVPRRPDPGSRRGVRQPLPLEPAAPRSSPRRTSSSSRPSRPRPGSPSRTRGSSTRRGCASSGRRRRRRSPSSLLDTASGSALSDARRRAHRAHHGGADLHRGAPGPNRSPSRSPRPAVMVPLSSRAP